MRWSVFLRSTQAPKRNSLVDQMSGLAGQGVRVKVVVSDPYEGYRINKFVLLDEFRRVLGSRSNTLDALKLGFFVLNGERNVEPTRLLKAGDSVELLEGYQSCLGAMFKLERRMSTENIKVFWKPPGFPVAPGSTMTENDEIRPREEGAFTSLYRVNRGVGAFLVMVRDGCSEKEYVLQSLSAVMRALVGSEITSSLSIPAHDGRMYEVSPLTSTKTGTGYVSTVDVECSPLDVSNLKDSLAKEGINVLTKSGGRTRSSLKGTYVSMISLRFSAGKDARTHEHTFHNEEPAKFRALREREEKFQAQKFTSVRYEDDMPLAYLRGSQEFDSLSLLVEKQLVIVPRKATETLVHACMNALGGMGVDRPRILDLGTGSGNIILALLNRLPTAFGVALDLSTDALRIASSNADNLRMSDRCLFHEADFAKLHESDKIPSELRNELRRGFDVIVCNPPYYSTDDQRYMSTSARKHEPLMGLITDGGSYKCYEDICRSIRECQNSGIEILRGHTGRLIFEVSSRGAHDVQEICESIADMKLESLSKDSYKLDRCLTFAPNLKPSEPGP
eukprot:CAMPEP_0184738278 /NCGR_PEP_ID=MMETSP0315-20130426/971_1 /TAXON_ID=101924 /ORGANISM="Rhodosorus marinus, Strain UTEX LB 2760" /LENGTH=561 /DNA_ID=CAMNT_0027205925 /DNA_START=318 /DNA_END=2003 /DNA_ORIENTATION=-